MNRSTTIALGIVTGFLFSATTPAAHAEPSHPDSARFTFGGSTIWEAVSHAEQGFFEVALSEDPVSRFMEWVEHGTVTDLCYAMVGIHYFDEALFAEVREEYSGRDLVIWEQSGCLVEGERVESVFERIASGAYAGRVERGIEQGEPPIFRWEETDSRRREIGDNDWLEGFVPYVEENEVDPQTDRPWIWVTEVEVEIDETNPALQIFKHDMFKRIRVLILEDGEPWLVAKDLAAELEYSKTADMLRFIDKEYRLKRATADFTVARFSAKARQILLINRHGILQLAKHLSPEFRARVTEGNVEIDETNPALQVFTHEMFVQAQPEADPGRRRALAGRKGPGGGVEVFENRLYAEVYR